MKTIKKVLLPVLFLFLMLCIPVHAQGNMAGEAVDKSNVNLRFYNEDGKEYKNLRKTVKKKTYIYLPKLPEAEGYKNKGWAVKAGGAVRYKAGAGVKITKTMSFYAVREEIKESCTVTFLNEQGELDENCKNLRVIAEKNSYITLPSMKHQDGKTFLGWSWSPFRSSYPDLKEGDRLLVKKDLTLYAVMFDRSTEKNITSQNLNHLNTKKYAKVIFVGDSRTNSMRKALTDEFSKKDLKNVSFVAKNGVKLSWFQKEDRRKLMNEISAAGGKPVAIVINLGVNDLKHVGDNTNFSGEKVAKKYIDYMKKLANSLRGRNCKLFYMSVNPVNGAMLRFQDSRREQDVTLFNQTLKKGLRGKFQFIDTNTWLHDNGYSTGRLYTSLDDGVHYEDKTYKRIYNYCIKAVNAA